MEYYLVLKKEFFAICDKVDEPRGQYAKWNKSDS